MAIEKPNISWFCETFNGQEQEDDPHKQDLLQQLQVPKEVKLLSFPQDSLQYFITCKTHSLEKYCTHPTVTWIR